VQAEKRFYGVKKTTVRPLPQEDMRAPSAMKRLDQDRYNIRVLDRAIDIVTLLADGDRRTLTEISEAVQLSSSTTYRLLVSLISRHFVERHEESNSYKLGLACLELAWAFRDGDPIRRLALPHLQVLRDATAETVHLGVLHQTDVVYLEKLPGLHSVGIMSSQVGARFPAYCTGLGKALLAFSDVEQVRALLAPTTLARFTDTTIVTLNDLMQHLAEGRQRGYVVDREEHEADICCVAAPLVGRDGTIVAAISVAGPASRLGPIEDNRPVISGVLVAARAISAALGYRRSDWPPRIE